MEFYKFEGTGNDFVVIDQRASVHISPSNQEQIARLCHRRLGIGADGLILLETDPELDFRMVYFNADGRESSMCGNGGRCIVALARLLGIIGETCRFMAIDGPHDARVLAGGEIALKMGDVSSIQEVEGCFVLNTGSPHLVKPVSSLDAIDVCRAGREIRFAEPYAREGINVNFAERLDRGLRVATYERGVEDETWSCGTGVTAAALAMATDALPGQALEIPVYTRGGQLGVQFRPTATGGFEDIWLIGPARLVFTGSTTS